MVKLLMITSLMTRVRLPTLSKPMRACMRPTLKEMAVTISSEEGPAVSTEGSGWGGEDSWRIGGLCREDSWWWWRW